MKKYTLLLLFLFIVGNTFAQKREEILRTLYVEGRMDNFSEWTIYPHEPTVKLVALGEEYIEEMLNLLEEGEIETGYANGIITALSFLEDEENKRFIDYLESKVYKRNHPSQRSSITAIFRIGGKPLEKFLNYLFLKDDFKFQLKILKKTWVLDNLDDLLLIKASLNQVMLEHPKWEINKYIKNDFVYKLDFALEVAKQENIPYLLNELKQIMDYKKKYFTSSTGGVASQWSLKKIVEITPLEEQANLLKYLNNRRYASDKHMIPNEYIVFQLYSLNQPIAERDKKALSPLKTAYSTRAFSVFRKAEEVKRYHSFREYVSSYKE